MRRGATLPECHRCGEHASKDKLEPVEGVYWLREGARVPFVVCAPCGRELAPKARQFFADLAGQLDKLHGAGAPGTLELEAPTLAPTSEGAIAKAVDEERVRQLRSGAGS